MKHIDVKKTLQEGNSNILSNLPNFVYTFFAKIVREDEINKILSKYVDFEGVDWINKIVEEFELKAKIEGKENLPENGRCFFVANHAYGMADGLLITKTIGEKYGKLKFIGNQVFGLVPNLRSLTIGVNVFDKSPRESLVALNKAYNSDLSITHFPNGKVSRIYKWKIKDDDWHKGFITKAITGKRNVVPIHFYGRNSRLFYFIYILRRIFFIKADLELALLPSELFKKKGEIIKIKIGKPIPYTTFDKSMSHHAWAQKVRDMVYDL